MEPRVSAPRSILAALARAVAIIASASRSASWMRAFASPRSARAIAASCCACTRMRVASSRAWERISALSACAAAAPLARASSRILGVGGGGGPRLLPDPVALGGGGGSRLFEHGHRATLLDGPVPRSSAGDVGVPGGSLGGLLGCVARTVVSAAASTCASLRI